MKVLIIDDSKFKRRFVNDAILYYFENNISVDVEIVEKEDFFNAIEWIKDNKNEINCIILDLGIPERKGEIVSNNLQGLKVIDYLKDNNIYDIPVIINSSTSINSLNLPDFVYEKIIDSQELTIKYIGEFLDSIIKKSV